MSVTRADYFSSDSQHDLNCVRTVVGSALTLSKNGAFALLGCEDVREVGRTVEAALDVISSPVPGKPFDPTKDVGERAEENFENRAHAIIDGLPFVGTEEGTLAAELAGDLLCRAIKKTFGTQVTSDA